MGQCPLYIPSDEDEDDVKNIESAKQSLFKQLASQGIFEKTCSGPKPSSVACSIPWNGLDEDRFLVPCDSSGALSLLDMARVDAVFNQDLNKRQKGYSNSNGMSQHQQQPKRLFIKNSNEWDNSNDDHSSDITNFTRHSKAGTEVTFHSVLTQKVRNHDKYKSDEPKRPIRPRLPSTSEMQRDSPYVSSNKDEKKARFVLAPKHSLTQDEDSDEEAENRGVFFSCVKPTTYVEDHRKSARTIRTLHLTMNANLLDFYVTKYLEMFPELSPTLSNGDSRDTRSDNSDGRLPKLVPLDSSQESSVSHHSISSLQKANERYVPPDSFQESNASHHSFSSLQKANERYRREVRIQNNGSSFLNLVVEGSLGLLENSNCINGALSPTPKKRLVLLDSFKNEPVAVCTLKSLVGSPVVYLYSPQPKWSDQTSSILYHGKGMYIWAQIAIQGEFPEPVKYSVSYAIADDEFEAEPYYLGSHVHVGAPNIQFVGRSSSSSSYTGCFLLSLIPERSGAHFSMKLPRGVDPALFICLTAIVDEVLEDTMRNQYYLNQQQQQRLKKQQKK